MFLTTKCTDRHGFAGGEREIIKKRFAWEKDRKTILAYGKREKVPRHSQKDRKNNDNLWAIRGHSCEYKTYNCHVIEHKCHAGRGIIGWETPYMDVSTTLHCHSCRNS